MSLLCEGEGNQDNKCTHVSSERNKQTKFLGAAPTLLLALRPNVGAVESIILVFHSECPTRSDKEIKEETWM